MEFGVLKYLEILTQCEQVTNTMAINNTSFCLESYLLLA